MDHLHDFLTHPPRFMRRHHVRYGGVHPPGTGRSHDFVLLRMPDQQARRRRRFLGLDLGETAAGVFEIRMDTHGNHFDDAQVIGRFSAVWSGYGARAVACCVLLGRGDRIMLCPDLTGCAIACAPQAGGGAYFSHYVLRYPQHHPRGGPHEGARLSVVGWREKDQWTFWTQHVEERGDVYRIRDVQQLLPAAGGG